MTAAAPPPRQKRRSPLAGGLRGNTVNTSGSNHSTIPDPLQLLLGGLKASFGLMPAGAPASISLGAKRYTSLVCTAHVPLASIGFTVANLFVGLDLRAMSPGNRNKLRQRALLSRWKVPTLCHEAGVLRIIANKLANGRTLDSEVLPRMQVAGLWVLAVQEVPNGG